MAGSVLVAAHAGLAYHPAMARAPRLSDVDLSVRVPANKAYKKRLRHLQLDLLQAQTRLRDVRTGDGPCPSLCIVFEGMDAAGKGGAIRRLTGRLDPRGYRVVPIGPPTAEEHSHHWLWRFAKEMPARGEIVIFDRSWYGRVLVERVEKFAPREAWRRAYEEIVAFERGQVREGVTLIKFWLHVSKGEQLRRFKEREHDAFKEYKIGPEDWRNRGHWHKYVRAADEAFRRTHTRLAPWTLVSGEDKQHTRLEVLRTTARRLRAARCD
jgi:polyphosphate kinase 2 (PPK2 family)